MLTAKYENVSSDFLGIIAGVDNPASYLYMEAKKQMETDNTKSMAQLKNFYADIEKTYKEMGKRKTDRNITDSRGNYTKFSGYNDIKYSFELLSKPLMSNELMKNLTIIRDSLVNNKSIFTEAYNRNIRLLMHEYENTLYLLQMGLCILFANCVEITKEQPGYRITNKRPDNKFIVKTIAKLANKLKNTDHKKYLESILEAAKKTPTLKKESVDDGAFTEDGIMDRIPYLGAFSLIISSINSLFGNLKSIYTSIKQSLFGIIPLIRSIIYLRYKKKADTILALEMNIALIKENIEILKRVKNKSDKEKNEIIKKQEAVCETYRKKIEKLKAELEATEYDASKALKQGEDKLKKTDTSSSDGNDDFILEGVNMSSIYNEIEKNNKNISSIN